jgi:hypothetical protein
VIEVIRTDDLFLGAYALLRGGEVKGAEVEGVNGRRMVFFRIDGAGIDAVERDYYGGETGVNLQLFKAQVNRLKSAAFEAVRREERRDASEPRGDRRDQAAERPGRGRHRAWD